MGVASSCSSAPVLCIFPNLVDGFLFLMLGTALYYELLIIPPLMPKPDPSAASQVKCLHLTVGNTSDVREF